MKRVVAVLVLVAMLVGFALSEDWQDGLEPYYVICNPKSWTNVRDFPNKKQPVTGRLEYGEEVWSDGQRKNGYVHVYGLNNEAGEGWVYHLYLDIWEPMDDVEGWYFNTSKSRVALRNGVNGKRIGWLKPDSKIYVLGMTAEWAVTDIGYLKADYLEEIADEKK